jgi:hypothetical protein
MIFRCSYEENPDCEGEKFVSQGEIESYESLVDFFLYTDSIFDFITEQLDKYNVISLNDIFEFHKTDEECPMLCGIADTQEEFLKNNFAVLVEY